MTYVLFISDLVGPGPGFERVVGKYIRSIDRGHRQAPVVAIYQRVARGPKVHIRRGDGPDVQAERSHADAPRRQAQSPPERAFSMVVQPICDADAVDDVDEAAAMFRRVFAEGGLEVGALERRVRERLAIA
jgi:hypothetical protein